MQQIDVVVCTPPPIENDTPLLATRRAELRDILAATLVPWGVRIVDFSTGWPAGLLSDGLHFNQAGKQYVAAAVAAVLEPFSH